MAGPEPFSIFRDRLQDGSEGPELVWLPPGRFLMGSPEADDLAYDDEWPQHEVIIPGPLAIGRFPETFDDYDRFCAATGQGKGAGVAVSGRVLPRRGSKGGSRPGTATPGAAPPVAPSE